MVSSDSKAAASPSLSATIVRGFGPWSGLPSRIHSLYIATRGRTGSWLAEAFASDIAATVVMEEVVGSTAGLARLRDEAFDCVLVCHEPGELDALELIEGYRAGGTEAAIIVLGKESEQEMAALCHEVGADGYVCVHTTTTRNLIWIAARAIQRHKLIRENYRLTLASQTQLQRDHDESRRLLAHQRALVDEINPLCAVGDCCEQPADDRPTATRPSYLPDPLIDHYRELLRAYIIMGSGSLTPELRRLTDLLVTAGVTSRQAMQLHLFVLEDMVDGLGARSTRHVMTRADLLILEVMLHIGEGYRERYQDRIRPPRQLLIPGFEGFVA